MSDWSYYARPGDEMWYSRKGSVRKVTIKEVINDDTGRPAQYVLDEPGWSRGLSGEKTHHSWCFWTQAEAEVRAERWRKQEAEGDDALDPVVPAKTGPLGPSRSVRRPAERTIAPPTPAHAPAALADAYAVGVVPFGREDEGPSFVYGPVDTLDECLSYYPDHTQDVLEYYIWKLTGGAADEIVKRWEGVNGWQDLVEEAPPP